MNHPDEEHPAVISPTSLARAQHETAALLRRSADLCRLSRVALTRMDAAVSHSQLQRQLARAALARRHWA